MFEAWKEFADELNNNCCCKLIATMTYSQDTCASTALSMFLNKFVTFDMNLTLNAFVTLYQLHIVYKNNYWFKDYIYATEGKDHAEKAVIINYNTLISQQTCCNRKDAMIIAIHSYKRSTTVDPRPQSFDQRNYFCILYDEYLYPDKHCIVIKTINGKHHLQDPLLRTCKLITSLQRIRVLQSCLTLLAFKS